MKRVLLPQPPNADDAQFKNNQPAFNRAVSRWMNQAKGLLEDASRINDSPLGQQFLSTNFTTNTLVSGTTTGTDLSNVVASLIQAMMDRGFVSATVTRSDP